ncbi:competence protein ComEA [Streptococcus varani]|uniref:Competence protein ComEA n=1 Tax=Streptococcus varani TaxID=1608583 RepID=A0A0E4H7V9_9STRE|nr:helix-hairpin-helix domain-containing protein [Streptococcus varani]CQR24811.1 competence protein ComEA [Streptococcus varani]
MFEDYLEVFKKNKLTIAGLCILVLAVGAFFVLQKAPEETSSDFPGLEKLEVVEESQEKLPSQDSDQEISDILVDVKGAVKKEGLYQLSKTARVHDAIQAAGGFSEQADKKSVNLAQKLTDEAVIYVAGQGEEISVIQLPTASSDQSASTGGDSTKVNLNTASQAELTTISGIGEKRAQDIIAYRDSNGGFNSVDDLKNVSGIGGKTLENIRPYVTLD